MSERLEEEMAKELGVYQMVNSYDWDAMVSRNGRKTVKDAIETQDRKFKR
jgi:hypothetical protein